MHLEQASDIGFNKATNTSDSPIPVQEIETEPASSHDVTVTITSRKNLLTFLKGGKYFDYIVVDYNGNEHRLHRLVLACHSDYFQAIFDNSFVESHVQRSHLTFPDKRNVLPLIFKYMYTGSIELTKENIVSVIHQAEYYQVVELLEACKLEVEKRFLPKHVLCVLRDACEYGLTDMIALSGSVLAENFDAVEWEHHGEDLNFLPIDVFLDILGNRALALDTEYRVYKVISNYTHDWKNKGKLPRLSETDRLNLYSKVYFEHLTVEQLEEALRNEDVPRDLLCEGFLSSLRMALGKTVHQSRHGRHYTAHMDTKRGRDFVYQSDWDTNGVIYWLGTQLDEKTFHNPHTSGHLVSSMSSIQTGCPANLVSRQNIPTCTLSQHPAWIMIDLGPSYFVLRPTHYTLKHGLSRDNVNLRRWRFEGSNDGQQWELLDTQENDTGLGGHFSSKTFRVSSERWYRYFRIATIGKFFCQIGGIELYGNLLPRTLDAAFGKL